MKTLLVLAVCWYVQDLVQILVTQTFLAPEFFAVALLDCATRSREPDAPYSWIAAALVGGFLLDLRWIGVPGLSAALYISALLAARWFWYEVPADSRKMLPYLVITCVLCLMTTPARLFFWDASVTSGRLLSIVGIQWLFTFFAVVVSALTRDFSYDEERL